MRLGAFAAAVILSLSCGITSASFHQKYKNSIVADYNTQLEKVSSASSYDEKLLYCLSAISIDPANVSAYDELINMFITKQSDSDETEPVFTADEDNILNSLILGKTDSIVSDLEKKTGIDYEGQSFSSPPLDSLKENSEDYAQFCYDTGIAYWFYYEDDTSRKSNAVTWFAKAEKAASEDSEIAVNASLYEKIGDFYNNIYDLNYRGADSGKYAEYWNNLKALNSTELDAGLKVRLYEEMLTNIIIYAANLKVDQVSYKDIADMIAYISKQLETDEISRVFRSEEIKKLVPQAVEKLNMTYPEAIDSSSSEGGEQ